MDLKGQIKKVVSGEIDDSTEVLEKFSKDASIFEIKPQLVVAPKSAADISNLIQFIYQNPNLKLSLTPRAGGTDMGGGPLTDSIVLDMSKYFNKISEIENNSISAQAGAYYKNLEEKTLAKNLLLPSYPASKDICSVGGMIANNAGGEKHLSFGPIANYTQSLKAILSDGKEYNFQALTKVELEKKISQKDLEGSIYQQIYQIVEENHSLLEAAKPQVAKNSTGYNLWDVWNKQSLRPDGLGKTFDLTKLLIGSQGTLGIITEVKFKLVPKATHSKLLVIFLNDLATLGEVINQVLLFKPEVFEVYDKYTLKLAVKYLPEIIAAIKPKHLLSMLLKFLPEEWMSLTHSFPELILLAEFTGNSEEEVVNMVLKTEESLKRFKLKTQIAKDEEEAKKFWTVRRKSFWLLKNHAENLYAAPFIDDIIVKPEYLPKFLPELRKILDEYKLIATIAGHIGEGNFHIIPLMDFRSPQTAKIIPEVCEKVFNLVFSYHGSMSGEHNDGLIRSHYLEKMYGPKIFALFKKVKLAFDPKNIFNPHKKTDGSFEYSFSHLIQDHQVLHHPNS